MSNVSTSLNRHYVKNGYHVVFTDEQFREVLIDVFHSKSRAVSFARQFFYKKIIEFFGEQNVPEGYHVQEYRFSDTKPYVFCQSFFLCRSDDKCTVLRVSVVFVNTNQHES